MLSASILDFNIQSVDKRLSKLVVVDEVAGCDQSLSTSSTVINHYQNVLLYKTCLCSAVLGGVAFLKAYFTTKYMIKAESTPVRKSVSGTITAV